jgi:hypothetical protein
MNNAARRRRCAGVGLGLNRDDVGPERRQPIEHAVQRCAVETRRHRVQVHGAKHQ